MSQVPDSSRPEGAGATMPFRGFSAPFYTMVPNEIFDCLMPELSGSELKVLLYVCRRTFGFGKLADGISLGQLLDGVVTKDGRRLDRGCGLNSKTSIVAAVKALVEMNTLVAIRQQSEKHGFEAMVYRLNVMGTASETPLYQKVDKGASTKSGQGACPETDTRLVSKNGTSLVPKSGPTKERVSKSMERKHHHSAEGSAMVAAGVRGDDDASRTALTRDTVLNGLVERMQALGLSARLALHYVAEHPAERIAQALDRLPHRKAQNPVGYFIAELRAGDFVAPAVMVQSEQEGRKVRALQTRMKTDQAAETAIAARVQEAMQGLSDGDRAALRAEARVQVARQSRRAVEDVDQDSPWVLGTFEHLVEVRYCRA